MSREPFGVRPRSVDEAVAMIERQLGTIADQQERITALETRIAEQRTEVVVTPPLTCFIHERVLRVLPAP